MFFTLTPRMNLESPISLNFHVFRLYTNLKSFITSCCCLFIHIFVFFFSTAAVNTDASVLGKYRAGYSECVGEVTRFLSTCEGVNTEVRTRLLGHLAACLTQINAVNFFTPHPAGGAALGLGQTAAAQSPASAPQMPCKSSSAMHASPDAMKLYGGFQVVPTPDGHFAFLVPSTALMPLSPQSSHHMSPVAPAVTSDSVWRPW